MIMTKKEHPKLSFHDANVICRGFIPIGDQIFDYMDRLQKAGFEAFLPFEEFVISFAHDAEDIEIHRRVVVERAKTVLGVPWPLSLVAGQKEMQFQSPYLLSLKTACEEENRLHLLQNRTIGQYAPAYVEVDPCRRKMAWHKATDNAAYEAKWAAVVESMKSRVEKECEHFATDTAKQYNFDRNGRYAVYTETMRHYSVDLGFSYDERKSRSNFPVFSKAINQEWDICWAIEEANAFCWSPFEGRFMPYVEIRHRNLRGTTSKALAGEYLHIRHSAVVPGFFNAYRIFYGLDELKTLVRAHLCLFQMMAPTIEDAARRVLVI